jgi:hypothetical protein
MYYPKFRAGISCTIPGHVLVYSGPKFGTDRQHGRFQVSPLLSRAPFPPGLPAKLLATEARNNKAGRIEASDLGADSRYEQVPGLSRSKVGPPSLEEPVSVISMSRNGALRALLVFFALPGRVAGTNNTVLASALNTAVCWLLC